MEKLIKFWNEYNGLILFGGIYLFMAIDIVVGKIRFRRLKAMHQSQMKKTEAVLKKSPPYIGTISQMSGKINGIALSLKKMNESK